MAWHIWKNIDDYLTVPVEITNPSFNYLFSNSTKLCSSCQLVFAIQMQKGINNRDNHSLNGRPIQAILSTVGEFRDFPSVIKPNR